MNSFTPNASTVSFRGRRRGIGTSRNTAVEIVCNRIKSMVLRREFVPGQKLSEIGLSEQLCVSRTPVREALKVLAGDGLLVLVPKSGVWVANPSKKEVEDAYAVRAKLESWAVSIAARNVTPVFLARLEEKIQEEAESSRGEMDVEKFLFVNAAFHMTIAEGSGNSVLVEHIGAIMEKTYLYMVFHERKFDLEDNPSLAEHIRLREAFVEEDEALCVYLIEKHIKAGFANLKL